MFRLMINTIFILVLAVYGELVNTSLDNYKLNKTASSVKNCCVNGRYDKKTHSCVGLYNEKYQFALLCRDLYLLESVPELEGVDPEEIEK